MFCCHCVTENTSVLTVLCLLVEIALVGIGRAPLEANHCLHKKSLGHPVLLGWCSPVQEQFNSSLLSVGPSQEDYTLT